MSKDETICFNEKDFKGSKLRCLELTNLNKNKIVNILNKLIKPYGEITGNNWMPKGFLNAKEAQLDKIDEIFIKKNKGIFRNFSINSRKIRKKILLG